MWIDITVQNVMNESDAFGDDLDKSAAEVVYFYGAILGVDGWR